MPLSYSKLGLALYHSLTTCLQYVLSELGTAIPEGLQQLWLDQQCHGDIKGSTHKLQIRKKLLLLNQPQLTVASPYTLTPIRYYLLAMKHDGALLLS